MLIHILGSGSGVLGGTRNYTSILVVENGVSVLVDAGPPILARLREGGLEKAIPSAIFVSHHHHDHVGGLFMFFYELEARGVRSRPVVIANETCARRLRSALDLFVRPDLHPDLVVLNEERPEELRIGHLRLASFPVRHSIPTLGLVIRSEKSGKSVFYSADTLFDPSLEEVAKGCDVCFHEATIPVDLEDRAEELGYHSSPRQAVRVMRGCGLRVLVHISELTLRTPYESEADHEVASDGMTLVL